MNATIETVGWTLVHSLWEGALIWLMLQLALSILSRSSARARYGAACAALALAIAAPAITFFKIEQHARHLASATGAATAQADQSTSTPLYPAAVRTDLTKFIPSAGAQIYFISRLEQTLVPALPWIVVLWMIGSALNLALLAVGWKETRKLAHARLHPIAAAVEARCHELADRLGIHRLVRIGESMHVSVPSVIGWLKPIILIPAGAFSGLTSDQIDGLLAHELAHVLRNDFLVNLLQSVCEVLFFYHPAIRAINRVIRVERENACDDIAVQVTGDAYGYAEALAGLEQARHPALALAATGDGKLLERIRRLVAPQKTVHSGPNPTGAILAAAAGALTVLAVTTIAAAGASAPSAAASASAAADANTPGDAAVSAAAAG